MSPQSGRTTNQTMLRFFGKLTLLTVLVLAACALINWVLIPNNPNAYQATTADKIRLASETASPKLMLVGGSNLAFSVDSEALAETTGMPVVNMGLSKASGMPYMLEEAKPHVRAGDVVVIAFEYEMYYDLYYGSEGMVVLLQHYPRLIKDVKTLGEWRNITSNFMLIMQMKFNGYLRTGVPSLENEVYRRDGFNQYGDLTTHLDLETNLDPRALFQEEVPFREAAVEALNAFAAHAEAQGATVYLSYAPLYEAFFTNHQSKIEDTDQRLRQGLSFPVISHPDAYTFPLDQMYDTPYHLLREGRTRRTAQLIQDLDSAL